MPSLLGRFVGLSFRTELLIMNIFGLVNSTLDWSPLKWTNKLEQIWNLSMPQRSLIVDTIGEDTIKTVLSWIVITRIVITHVYTFTYLSNIYPIITWSRPNLLLPWLILSFFKNVVLEVVVIVIGLLLWYGSPFSLVVFLEFIFIKLVPLVMASYNWYSNSCLFLQLRHTEKMRKLRRSMRSDSNLLTNQLYVKIDEPRYRTGSLTTLFSYDSCETYNPDLTPGQNAKKLLGITEQDVADALGRIKEREAHKRLTELDDDDDLLGDRTASKGYFFGSSIYRSDIFTDDVSDISAINHKEPKNLKDFENTKNDDNLEAPVNQEKDSLLNIIHQSTTEKYDDAYSVQEEIKAIEPYSDAPETVEKLENPASNNPKNTEEDVTVVADVSTEVLASEKVESLELVESSVQEKDIEPATGSEEEAKVDLEDDARGVERSPSPVNSQAVFICSCAPAKSASKESRSDASKATDMTTSTPRERSDNHEDGQPPENSKKSSDQPYTHAYSVTEVKTNRATNSGFPLMEKVLKNDLEILKSMKTGERCHNSAFNGVQDFRKVQEDRSNIFLDGYGGHFNASVDVQDIISGIAKDLNVSMNRMTIDTNRSENATPRSDVWPGEIEISKLNVPECPSDNPNPPRFYQDFMKVFDGCYQNDFANNSELKCAFQQMEKKKWNLFSGQTDLETLLTSEQGCEADEPPRYDSSGSTSRRSARTEDSESPKSSKMEAACRPPEKRLLQIEDLAEPATVKSTKNIGTQTTGYVGAAFLNSDESVRQKKAKARWRYYSKKNQAQHQKGSDCQMSHTKLAVGKKDSSSSRTRSNSPHASKSSLNDCSKLNGSKSFSNWRDCKCKMKKLKKKCSPTSLDNWEDKYKATAKSKVDSLATLPLAQVTRRPETNRIKPPVYPKKNKEAHTAAAVDKTWRSSTGKRTEQTESKKSMDSSQSTSSSKRTSRSRAWTRKTKEEIELRALKAYNEITLLEDKKKLDARRRTLERLPSERDGKGSYKRFFARRDLGKENLSADSTNATSSSSRSNKPPPNAAVKSGGSVSNGKQANPKSSKIAKPVNKQENLDRLFAMDWLNQARELQNSVYKDDAENIVLRHASRNYEMSNAASVGTFDMKLKDAKTGHNLAEEDARSAALPAKADAEPPGSRVQGRSSRADAGGVEPEDKELVKKSAEEDAASTGFSSSDDLEAAAKGNSAEQQDQDPPRVEEEGAEVLEDFESASDGVSKKEESIERRVKASENSGSVKRQDEDVGNVVVVCQDNSVVPWEEKDSATSTVSHNLLSFKLIDFLATPLSQFMLKDNRKLEEFSEGRILKEEFSACRAIVPAIPETQDLGTGPHEPITVGNIAAEQKIESVNLETEDKIDDLEGIQVFDLCKEQVDDILGSVTEVLKRLNILENEESLCETQDKIAEIEKFKEEISWLKEDIFTSIKFPIVIKAAEISPDVLRILDGLLSPPLANQAVKLKKPIGPNLGGLTIITEEDEEVEASLQDSNLENTVPRLSLSPKFLSNPIIEELESTLDIANMSFVTANDASASSLDMEYTIGLGSPMFDDDRASLDKTYDILQGCSDDDTGVRTEETDEDDQNTETCDSEMSKVDTSIEFEKLENDRSETSDAALEEIIARMVKSLTINVEESDEEPVQDEELEERRSEAASESDVVDDSARDEELVEDSVDEGIDELSDEDAGSGACEEQICPVKIVDSFQSKESETALQRVDEIEDVDCRSISELTFEQSCEDDGGVRKLDKHEQEEKITNEVCEEGIRTMEEAEDSVRDEDVASIVDRFSSSAGECEGREQNVGLLKSNEDAEKREQRETPRPVDAARDATIAGADENLSLKIILIFFLQVCYFYIRHFYRKVCSFAQISRATPALKPFEVHTVSTSTSTLIEKAGFVDKVREESLVEENEETFENSVDFETMNISRVIEERLQGVLDLTTERCASRNSDFEADEMTVALRRETAELGLSSNVSLVGETTEDEMDTEFSKREESFGLEERSEVQAFRFKDFRRPGSSIFLRSESSPSGGQLGRDTAEVQNTIRELSLTVDVGKVEDSSKDGRTMEEDVEDYVEEIEDASAVQFETALEDMDSFNSIYMVPSETIVPSKTASCSKLDDDDDMEEFSAVSSRSSEPTR
nr:uncharacterized protein LOC117228638 [Megalopta genalis]